MPPTWSLRDLLGGLHEEIEQRLALAHRVFAHPGTKGNASENVWLEMLERYLPHRYRVATAHVVDSDANVSDQIDVVVFDRQYTPFVFRAEGQTIIPAESVYAVFEAKQTVNAANVRYAQEKVGTVRKLKRTSLPIPHAGGTYPPKPLQPILGGLLAFESDWTPPLGAPLTEALRSAAEEEHLDLGCVAAQGIFQRSDDGEYALVAKGRPATAFLLELIARLQASATVPMIDVRAYARWLDPLPATSGPRGDE